MGLGMNKDPSVPKNAPYIRQILQSVFLAAMSLDASFNLMRQVRSPLLNRQANLGPGSWGKLAVGPKTLAVSHICFLAAGGEWGQGGHPWSSLTNSASYWLWNCGQVAAPLSVGLTSPRK